MPDNMRYNKFLLEDSEIPIPPKGDGLIVVKNNISEVEACENSGQAKLMECLFYTLVELFEAYDLELQTSGHCHSFLIIIKEETRFNLQEGFESPHLSRDKLKNASARDVSGAIIDLVRNRKNWNNKRKYQSIYL